jgi:O-methyltransferase involved in polyketide biosynthesis
MLALEARDRASSATRIEVMGTDVCEAFVREARVGSYPLGHLEDLPEALRSRYLEASGNGRVQVGARLREVVSFRRHNLIDSPPGRQWALIVCRNVLMYLHTDARDRALEHIASALARDGLLLVGHGDSLRNRPNLFQPAGTSLVSMYRPANGQQHAASCKPHSALRATRRQPGGRQASTDTVVSRQPSQRCGCEDTGTARVALEGVYDGNSGRTRLEALRGLLAQLVARGAKVEVMADGAESLDAEVARLLVRASRLAAQQGGSVRVHGSRGAVLRWAQRHGLPVTPPDSSQQGDEPSLVPCGRSS